MSINLQELPRQDGSSAPAAIHLFLSYNSRDRAAVQQVRKLLGARGVSVFIDKRTWASASTGSRHCSRRLAGCAGWSSSSGRTGSGAGNGARAPWPSTARRARSGLFPVIPVLLPGSQADDYSGFLLLNTYADLRGGLDDPNTLDAIERAVRGTAAAGEPAPPPGTAAICPYRGLNAFREEDAPLFFGRDRLVDEPEQGLLHKMLTCPLVAVVGASGSGKSSVVRAGLLPRLRREPPSRGTWDTVVFRPGKYPFLNLAIALEAVRNPEASDAARETDAAALVKSWSRGDLPIEVSLGRGPRGSPRRPAARGRGPVRGTDHPDAEGGSPAVPVAPAGGDRTGVGVHGPADAPCRLLWSSHRPRPRAVRRHPARARQCRGDDAGGACAAIEGPARRVGLEFEPGLVERLLDDVGDEPGNLPLLEFALTEMWEEMRERREVRRLINVAYEALGRVAGAIGRRAETVFNKLKEEQKTATKRLFGQLVRVTDVDEEGRDTRQRVRLGDLDEASRSVVEPFVAGRLLVTARDPGSLACACVANLDDSPSLPASDDPTTVEVAHEALIRTWDRLRGWVKEDREFLLWRQRLGFHIAEWERSDRDEEMLLRGALLKEAEDFKSSWDDLNNRERDFLTRPQAAAARFRRAESRRLAAFSVSQRDKRLDLALLLATEALKAEPTFEARGNFLEALQPSLEEPLGRTTVEYWQTCGKHLQTFQMLTTLLTTPCNVVGVAFSPDGMALAAWYGSGVDLWHVAAHAAGRGVPGRARG